MQQAVSYKKNRPGKDITDLRFGMTGAEISILAVMALLVCGVWGAGGAFVFEIISLNNQGIIVSAPGITAAQSSAEIAVHQIHPTQLPSAPEPALASKPTDTPVLPPPTSIPSPQPTPTNTRVVPPTPTETPAPTNTPTAPAKRLAVSGRPQSLPLDCEARSAVDWAAYFGVPINELEFFERLAVSDDPDAGFVGDVYGAWGQLPPGSYGVHAEPVAALLDEYGLKARAVRGLAWEAMRGEIDAGRPVMAWVVGHVEDGTPVAYTASNGHTTVVARYEHTVLVIGYTDSDVTVLDGNAVYNRSLPQFMQSWAVLGNMAVLAEP